MYRTYVVEAYDIGKGCATFSPEVLTASQSVTSFNVRSIYNDARHIYNETLTFPVNSFGQLIHDGGITIVKCFYMTLGCTIYNDISTIYNGPTFISVSSVSCPKNVFSLSVILRGGLMDRKLGVTLIHI